MATPSLVVVLSLPLLTTPVAGGSLKDIEHVIIFMQENRSWNSVCPPLLELN